MMHVSCIECTLSLLLLIPRSVTPITAAVTRITLLVKIKECKAFLPTKVSKWSASLELQCAVRDVTSLPVMSAHFYTSMVHSLMQDKIKFRWIFSGSNPETETVIAYHHPIIVAVLVQGLYRLIEPTRFCKNNIWWSIVAYFDGWNRESSNDFTVSFCTPVKRPTVGYIVANNTRTW